MKEKVVSICIVPGNHDKFRTKANEFLIPAYRNMGNDLKDKFDDNFYNTFCVVFATLLLPLQRQSKERANFLCKDNNFSANLGTETQKIKSYYTYFISSPVYI